MKYEWNSFIKISRKQIEHKHKYKQANPFSLHYYYMYNATQTILSVSFNAFSYLILEIKVEQYAHKYIVISPRLEKMT